MVRKNEGKCRICTNEDIAREMSPEERAQVEAAKEYRREHYKEMRNRMIKKREEEIMRNRKKYQDEGLGGVGSQFERANIPP